jgi:hypothetical protein
MSMFRKWWVAFFFACAGSSAFPVQVEGVEFAQRVAVAEQELVLNGAGVRASALIKPYVMAMYLSENSSTAAAAIEAAGAKRLQLRMLVPAGSRDFHRALVRGMHKNSTADELSVLQGRMAQFEQMIQAIGVVRAGDVIDMDFVPVSGTTLSVNGQPRGGVIGGKDFFSALMKIFVGDVVSDEPLKKALLGR